MQKLKKYNRIQKTTNSQKFTKIHIIKSAKRQVNFLVFLYRKKGGKWVDSGCKFKVNVPLY